MTVQGGSPITHLRHVGMAVTDFKPAVEFYENIWGLKRVADDSGVAFFGTEANPEHYIIRVREADQKRLDVISFAVDDASEVDALAERLGTAGIQLDREPNKLDTPGGGYGVRFFDPDGRLVEVSSDVEMRPFRELEPEESIPKKLSHVVINTPDVKATKAFYETHLGFKLSDWLEDFMCFMRTSVDHHSLAIAKGPHTSLNHVSFEMRGLDEYMRGTGRLMRTGRQPLWGPGRHGPGDNTFSYFLDPNRNVMEYTTELEQIHDDDAWEPRVYEATPEASDQWGTGGLITEWMIPIMYNDPDPGLWNSAPV